MKGKSAKKGRPSPSKTEIEIKRKKKVNFNLATESNYKKIPEKSQKNQKYKMNSGQKVKSRKGLSSFQVDSPVRKGDYYYRNKRRDYSTSGTKPTGLWREKKTTSCSLIERYH